MASEQWCWLGPSSVWPWSLSFFLKIFFIWLYGVFVAICKIFSHGMWTLSCAMWNLAPWPGMKPLHWEHGVLATGPPGKSQSLSLFLNTSTIGCCLYHVTVLPIVGVHVHIFFFFISSHFWKSLWDSKITPNSKFFSFSFFFFLFWSQVFQNRQRDQENSYIKLPGISHPYLREKPGINR